MNTEIKKTYLRDTKIDHNHLFNNITAGVALHERIPDKKSNSVNYQFVEIIKLLSKAKSRSYFLEKVCKYLVKAWIIMVPLFYYSTTMEVIKICLVSGMALMLIILEIILLMEWIYHVAILQKKEMD